MQKTSLDPPAGIQLPSAVVESWPAGTGGGWANLVTSGSLEVSWLVQTGRRRNGAERGGQACPKWLRPGWRRSPVTMAAGRCSKAVAGCSELLRAWRHVAAHKSVV